MDLNSPDVRQDRLRTRLAQGRSLIAAQIAEEFAVSFDTVRRDLMALEVAGQARRVRGGAVPVAAPSVSLSQRLAGANVDPALVRATLKVIGAAPTVLMDGGATVLAIADALAAAPGRLVITPSPRVALAVQASGIEVVLLGGTLGPRGGIATGVDTEDRLGAFAADLAVLGACGMDPDFGLSADDLAEAGVKRAMAAAARCTLVVTGAEKLHRKARHRVLPTCGIDLLITDAARTVTDAFAAQGLEIHHA